MVNTCSTYPKNCDRNDDERMPTHSLEYDNRYSRKFKFITISITAHISSAFNLHSNSFTYSQIKFPNPSYTGFSVPSKDHTLFKKHDG